MTTQEHQSSNPQVLIVGAGPVGLTMAAELARYGVSVRIVDKAAQRTDKSKAIVIWSRTLELLDRGSCSAALVAAGHRVDAANIVAGDKLIGRVGFADVDSPYPYALMLPQSETERLLETHLNSLGIRIERQVEVTGFTDSGTDITTVLRHADGHEELLTTEWLIGCDGAHSTVRHTLGLPFTGETLKSDWVLADIHLSGMPMPTSELATYWHEDGVLAMFPMSANRYRIIADVATSGSAHSPEPTLDQIQAIVDRRGPGKLAVSDPVWLSAFRINERKVKDYRLGRAFLAGDAAHVHSPAGGQGMNTGMQDAVNLAWKLALVCRGSGAAGTLLDSYSAERSAVGEQVLAAAGRLTAIAVMKNHTAQTVRNLLGGFLFGLAPLRRRMADTMSEVSIGYAHSPLNGSDIHAHAGPAPGERTRPVSGQSPVGAGDAPRFALFAYTSDSTRRLLLDYPDLLEPASRPPLGKNGMWLVRPDGYVACVAKPGDVQTIANYLNAIDSSAGINVITSS